MEPAPVQLIEPGSLVIAHGPKVSLQSIEAWGSGRRYVIAPCMAGYIIAIPPDCGFFGMVLGTAMFGELNSEILGNVDLFFNTPHEQRVFDDTGLCYVLAIIKAEAGKVSLWHWRNKIVIVPFESPFIELTRF